MVSARAASPSIRPVLIYYSLLNFALCEILAKQDGQSSLDKARERNTHHGLEIAFSSQLLKAKDFGELSQALVAKPHYNSSGRSGTFNLWHTTSREHPVVGKITNSINTHTYSTVLGAYDSPLPIVGDEGLNLLECLKLLPSMEVHLRRFGFASHYARAHIEVKRFVPEYDTLMFTLHPCATSISNGVLDGIRLSLSAIEDLHYADYQEGFGFKWNVVNPQIRHIHLPMITSLSTEEQRICSVETPLNEFGAFYFTFFILGNLCRYFPDFWMPKLELHSDFSVLVDVLCEEFFLRVPSLVLGELGRTLYVHKPL